MADLNQPFKITEKANAYVEKTLGKVEPKFVQQVVDWINKFSTTNGRIIRTDANIARVGAFRTAVERFLKRAGYSEMVANYLTGFDAMANAQQEIHKDLNGIELKKSFINTFKTNAIQNVITAMEGQGLQQSLVNPLKQELFIAVNQGSSLTDVVQSISKQLTTTEQRQGVLKRIALQSSRDALGQYDGVVNEAVRNVYKLDALLYVGSLVKDSRPQCERWVNYMDNGKLGLILFDQLQDEIDWALTNGTGFIPETTPENFCQNRGGYNCRHTCYPVRNPNKITEKGNVKENVNPVISKKEQTELIGLAKYTNAKTVSEAKDNINNIIKDNLNINLKSVQIDDKLSIEQINNLNKQLYTLSNEYKSTFNLNSKPNFYYEKPKEYGVAGKVEYYTDGDLLSLYFGNANDNKIQLQGRIQKRFENNKFADYSKVDENNLSLSVLTHEFGHFISVDSNTKNDSNTVEFWNELKKVKKQYTKDLKENINNSDGLEKIFLGKYASTNIKEFMAEGFTEYKLSSNPTKYAMQIGKLIDKYFKK
jgi:hypothetical protein